MENEKILLLKNDGFRTVHKSLQRFTETWALLERASDAGLFGSAKNGRAFWPKTPFLPKTPVFAQNSAEKE